MAEVGSAFVSILPSAKGFGRKLDSEVGGEVDSAGKRTGSRFGTAIKAGAIAVMAGGAIAAGFLKDAIGEAREAQKIGAITEQVIKTTGAAAGVTAKQVGDLATAISNKTGIDDEAIQSASNLLLTFTKVRNEVGKGNDIFNQATQAATDMAAALGTEPKNAALQLGKALNDPIKGVTALSRAGVSFTEQQKEQIKTLAESGNVLGAQKIILSEMQIQFGGAAAASSTAGEKMAVAFGNLKEQIGTALLPIIDRMAATFTTKIIPAVSGFIAGMQAGTGAGGQFVAILKGAAGALATVAGFVKQNADFFIPFVAALGTAVVVIKTIAAVTKVWAAAQAAMNVVLAANPIGLVIVALAALVAGLVVAYKRSETFRNIVNGAFQAVKSVVTTTTAAIKAVVTTTWAAIQAATRTAWEALKNTVLVPVRALLAVLQGDMGRAKAIVREAWDAVREVTRAAWEGIKQAVSNGINAAVEVVRSLPGKAKAALGNVGTLLYSAGRDLIQGMINGVRDMVGSLVSAAGDVVGSAINAAKSKLGINSPSKVFLEIGHQTGEGLRLGLADMQGPVQRQMSRLALPDAASLAGPQVSLSDVSGGGSDVLGELRAVRLTLERMPKAYRVGERQGA